jgi:SAM-dependent methyltransferase
MDRWDEGDRYERYMGRWSAAVAASFLPWVAVAAGGRWLDVGCGTGVLSDAISRTSAPSRLGGVDASAEYVAVARGRLGDGPDLRVGDAQALPFPTDGFDATVSGLCLNFIPDPAAAVGEMHRVTRAGGMVAAYVWDYAEGMQMLRRFWDAACDLDPTIRHLDEATRFPLCRPGPLAALFTEAGLDAVETTALTVPTTFSSFGDYWDPFLDGQGPAPAYVSSLDEHHRSRLASTLEHSLPRSRDGAIALTARAWAVKGVAT